MRLQSVLGQLSPGDEVVIVDDASTDRTVDVIESLGDPRIRLIRSPVNEGHVAAFEQAMSASRGDSLLLADQDDVWTPGRVGTLVSALESHAVVASNFRILGDDREQAGGLRLREEDGGRVVRNVVGILLGRRPYFGCAMGRRREVLGVLLPFPNIVEAHDLWVAIVGNVLGEMGHVGADTLLRRVHDQNLTPKTRRRWMPVLRARIVLTGLILVAAGRRYRRAGDKGQP